MEKEKNPIQVSERIFVLVEELAECGPIGLVELSSRLGLHKSTVHRILNSLQLMGYVRQSEDGKYALSLKWMDISSKVINKFDIVATARPYLKKICEISGETVHLVEMDGVDAIYIDKVESFSNSIRMVSKIGSRIPLFCSGVGKAILASKTDEEIKSIWEKSDVKAMTPNTITDFKDFLDTINQIRVDGYALDNEENETGVRCIAACILSRDGKCKNAFSISAPINRMTDEKIGYLAKYVIEMKNDISSEMGYKK